jgi:hypothetical protein
MNSQEEFNDNIMQEFLNSSTSEKAPAGFTEKLMNRISLETRSVKPREKLITRYKVPIISVTVTMILTAIALLSPAAGNGFSESQLIKIFKDINLPQININLDSLFSFAVPGYLPYLFICTLCLTIFDRGLSMMFHRGK